MTKNNHPCKLSLNTTGLPKLAPNASWMKRKVRVLWQFILLNPNHFKCRALFRNRSQTLSEKFRHANSKYFFVIHPLSMFNSVLKVIFFLLWLYALICESLIMMDFKNTHSNFMLVNHYVVFPCRLFIVLMFFNIGYIDKNNEIVIQPKRIIFRYLTTYFFFDFLTTYWPHMVVLHMQDTNTLVGSELFIFRCVNITYIISLLACFVRVYTILGFMDDTLNNMRCSKITTFIILNLFKTFVFIHICACAVFFVPYVIYSDKFSPDSWLTDAKVKDFPGFHELYFECLLIAVTYFFGISERHSIVLLPEQICMIIITFFGRLYTLFLLADILNMLGIAGVSESKYERQLSMLRQYMATKNLPDRLRHRMLKYFEFKYQGQFFKENDVIAALSDNLRTELFLFAAGKLTRKAKLFRKLPKLTVAAIIATMNLEIYSPGDVIVRIGSELRDLFFISSGTVAVVNETDVELCHLEDGDEFGMSSLIMQMQMYGAVAVETTEVFYIDKNVFLRFLQPHPDVRTEYYRLVQEKLARIKVLEEKATASKVDLMSELQKGHILEKFTKRPRFKED